MNENARRGRQWQRLVGGYFSPRLGGAPEAWAAANAHVANRLFAEYETHFDADPGASFLTYWTTYQEAWLSGMCTAVGVALPADRATLSRLCRDCEYFVTRRVRAAYPGVVQEIRRLHAAGYVLRTASGERSWELEGYLIVPTNALNGGTAEFHTLNAGDFSLTSSIRQAVNEAVVENRLAQRGVRVQDFNEIMRDVDSSHKLAKVLEATGCILKIGAGW